MLSPSERKLRARIGALSLHAQGKTNTGPATAAFKAKFYDQVDPDRTLPEAERDRRAGLARQAHMTKLSLARSRARTAQARPQHPDAA